MYKNERKGWELFNQKKYSEAIDVFDSIFKSDKKNTAAFQGKIAALRKKHDFRNAGKLLEIALVDHPKHTGILNEKAWLCYDQNDYISAIAAFKEVLAVDAKEEIFLWAIDLLRSERDFEEANKLIAEAIGLFPQSLRLSNQRGWLLFNQMLYDDAIATFDGILKDSGKDELALQGKIASLRGKGSYSEATRTAMDALGSKACPGIYNELGWINFEQGHYEEAERYFQEESDLIPDNPAPHVKLAWSLVQQGTEINLNRAITHCRKALDIQPNLAQAYGCLGNIAFKRGHVREAEAYFVSSIKFDLKKGSHADLGALYTKIGRYDEAEKTLKVAIKNNPDDAYAHSEMGDLYLQTGKVREAIQEFRSAMASDPHNPEPFRALAIALMESNKLTEAEKILRTALRLLDESQKWTLHLTLSHLLTRIGDETNDRLFYEEALKEIGIALRLKPGHIPSHFQGGIVRFKLEDYQNALNDFRRCLIDDEYRIEAGINVKRVQSLINSRSRASLFASAFLTSVFMVQLLALWILRFTTDKITETMINVLVPILLGLIVVAVILPWLNRLKMTGLEAELSQPMPKESLASGPKGIVSRNLRVVV